MTEEDTGQEFAGSTDGGDVGGEAGAGLVARVAAHDEELAGEVATLEQQADTLETTLADCEAEIEELTERLKRAKADFQNYKQRAERRREELEQRATEDLVERLLEVRDNLERALDQDEDADIRPGVEATLRSFDDVLAAENVDPIEPSPGDELVPERHEAIQRVEADQPEGTVVEVFRTGYEMADTVLRPAQVTVVAE